MNILSTEAAYLQDLLKGTTNKWATNEVMSYNNWTSTFNTDNVNRPIRLNKNGGWDVEQDRPEGSALLCNVDTGTFRSCFDDRSCTSSNHSSISFSLNNFSSFLYCVQNCTLHYIFTRIFKESSGLQLR